MRVRNRDDLLQAVQGVDRARRASLLDAYEAALEAVDPAQAVRRALEGRLATPVYALAFGKAARSMAEALIEVRSVRDGFIVSSDGSSVGRLRGRPGGHPRPRADASFIGREVLEWAEARVRDDTVVVLVSGGGSAMLELPDRGWTLEALADRAAELLASGADIGTVNAFRASASRLKGGRLLAALRPARVLNLVLSDVAPHGPELVASGPTVGEGAETVVVADGAMAAAAAAVSLGVPWRSDPMADEARAVGRSLVGGSSVVCFGEPTVTVRGHGRGGRCRELALAALEGIGDGAMLAAGTDGVDGSGGVAGAIVDAPALKAARERGLEPRVFLDENDSGTFFDALETAVITGPTGTNVADLVIYLAGPSRSETATSPR